MKITYDEAEDILHIVFSDARIVRDVSYGWNFQVGYSEQGLAEITVLDAKAQGHWPPVFDSDLKPEET